MTTGFGSLSVEITADATSYTATMKNVEGQLASTQAKMNRALAAVEKSFRSVTGGLKSVLGPVFSLKAAFASLVGAGGFGLLVKNAIDSADAIVDMAGRIGISTDALQQLMYMASQSGLSIEQLETGLRKLNDNIALGAAGAKGNVLGQLGIAARDAAGNLRPLEAVLLDVADAFQKAGPQSAAGIKILTEAFGSRSGTAFAGALKDGAAGVRQLMADAQRLGLVLEADLLRGANSANDALDRMKMIVGTNLTRVLLQLAPGIERLAQLFAEGAPHIERWSNALSRSLFGVGALGTRGLQEEIRSINEEIAALDKRAGDRQRIHQKIPTQELREREELIKRLLQAEQLLEESRARDDATGRINPGGTLPAGMNERPDQAKMEEFLASLRESVQLAQQETAEREVLEATLRAEALAREDFTKGLRASRELTDAERDSVRGYVQLRTEANLRDAESKKLKDEAKQLYEQTRTPAEAYAATLQRINELLAAGAINEGLANRARAEAQKTFEQADEDAKGLKATADQLTMSLESAFTAAVQGGKGMQDIIAALIQDIVQMILKLFILKPLMDAIAASMRSILGGGGSTGGFSFGTILGHGSAPSSAFTEFSMYPGAANGASWRVGGSGGTDSQLAAFRVSPGELIDVSTPAQAAGRDGGGTVVNVINKTDGKARVEERQGESGEKIVEVIIERAIRRPGSSLNRAFSETFGSRTQLATRG